MERTPFAGLTILLPGEPPSTDGFSAQLRNPALTDQLFQRIFSHRHNELAALPSPTDPPAVAPSGTGGTIPPDVTCYFGYTLVDAMGGETTISGLASAVTPEVLGGASAGVSGVADYAAGSLLPNTYYYAMTVTDGLGGETTEGPTTFVVREAGHASGQITLSGMADLLLTVGGAVGWRLFRSINGDEYRLLATGTSADNSFLDDGSVNTQDFQPPVVDTTNGQALFIVTPPAVNASAVQIKLYGSVNTPDFISPALITSLPAASAGVPYNVLTTDFSFGSPPPVSLSKAGPGRIDAETELFNYYFKPPVPTAADLQPAEQEGEARFTLDDFRLHVWAGAAWHDQSAFTSFWKDPVADEASLPPSGNTTGDVRLALAEGTISYWDSSAWVGIGGGGGGSSFWADPVDTLTTLDAITTDVDGTVRAVVDDSIEGQVIAIWKDSAWVRIISSTDVGDLAAAMPAYSGPWLSDSGLATYDTDGILQAEGPTYDISHAGPYLFGDTVDSEYKLVMTAVQTDIELRMMLTASGPAARASVFAGTTATPVSVGASFGAILQWLGSFDDSYIECSYDLFTADLSISVWEAGVLSDQVGASAVESAPIGVSAARFLDAALFGDRVLLRVLTAPPGVADWNTTIAAVQYTLPPALAAKFAAHSDNDIMCGLRWHTGADDPHEFVTGGFSIRPG